MLNKTESSTAPERVIVENLPDGKTRVVLHDNIKTTTTEPTTEQPNGQTVYTADEVTFALAEQTTKEAVEAAFESWWQYGLTHGEKITEPTIEERIAALESYVAVSILSNGGTN